MAGTLEVPAIGEFNKTADPKIVAAVKKLNDLLNGENLIPGGALAADVLGFYRNVLNAQQTLVTDLVAGTYILGSSQMGQNPVKGSGTGENAGVSPPTIYLAKADQEVSGRTQKLRLRAQIHANGTKPALKFTVGLYPVTVSGGSDGINWTFGTVVTGSQVEINEPAASTATSAVSSDFTFPSDGAYMLGVVTSNTLTNNSLVLTAAQLQARFT